MQLSSESVSISTMVDEMLCKLNAQSVEIVKPFHFSLHNYNFMSLACMLNRHLKHFALHSIMQYVLWSEVRNA